MKKIAKIKIKRYSSNGYDEYKINLSRFYDLSIPINSDGKSPSFYDKHPLKIKYYTDEENTIWATNKGASCNVPVIDLNIHCGTTHSECRSHITKENLTISEIISMQDSFIPASLISVTPSHNIGNDTYHHKIESEDLIITKDILRKKMCENLEGRAIIIRTLPNLENEIRRRNYNSKKNAFFSNEAINYLRILGVKYLVVDLPSIDKFDDGGRLGNHRIFWGIDEHPPNDNIITEFAVIKNQIKDGKYLLSLNTLNINLDASPCRPIIYPILKLNNCDTI